MSRSVKKNPICGWASCDSVKIYRTQENKAKRRKVNILLNSEKYDSFPHEKEYGNEWASPRDGKQRFDPKQWPKGMRK